jgi:cellulose synthase/poly-beta-1,6-N-acetylglucosamine synthase-like glycosyltransferase
VENVRIALLTTVKAGIVRIARDLMPTMKEATVLNVLTTAKVVLMIVLNVLPTTVKVVLMTVLNVPVSIAAKVVIVLNVLLTTVKVATVLTVPVLITAKVATVLNVLLTTVKVVTVRIVPVLITAKVAAIAAITAVGEVTVRDTTMTVHKEAIVLVRVPAIMIRMLSIA